MPSKACLRARTHVLEPLDRTSRVGAQAHWNGILSCLSTYRHLPSSRRRPETGLALTVLDLSESSLKALLPSRPRLMMEVAWRTCLREAFPRAFLRFIAAQSQLKGLGRHEAEPGGGG